jgi:hypothetical protein
MPDSCLIIGVFIILNTGVQGCSQRFEHGVFRRVHNLGSVQTTVRFVQGTIAMVYCLARFFSAFIGLVIDI